VLDIRAFDARIGDEDRGHSVSTSVILDHSIFVKSIWLLPVSLAVQALYLLAA